MIIRNISPDARYFYFGPGVRGLTLSPQQEIPLPDFNESVMAYVQKYVDSGNMLVVEAGAGAGGGDFVKVGTAFVGGDQTGNARGAYALDVQARRDRLTQVASGDYSTAIGHYSTASGNGSVASGFASVASGINSVSSGYGSVARIQNTEAASPHIIERNDSDNATTAVRNLTGPEMIFTTPVLDLKTVADFVLTLPEGSRFSPREVGLWVTSSNTVTVAPTVRFGITGTPDKILAATEATAAGAPYSFAVFNTLDSKAGETTLSAGVTVPATATAMSGRFYWKGIFIEADL